MKIFKKNKIKIILIKPRAKNICDITKLNSITLHY